LIEIDEFPEHFLKVELYGADRLIVKGPRYSSFFDYMIEVFASIDVGKLSRLFVGKKEKGLKVVKVVLARLSSIPSQYEFLSCPFEALNYERIRLNHKLTV
jgi:hypothetical protein